MEPFAVGQDVNHRIGDARCPACVEDFPEPCDCGGLVHAAASDLQDPGNVPEITTRCDRCNRSDDDLAEAV